MKRWLLGALAVMLVLGSAPAVFAQVVPGAFLLYPNYRGLIFDDRPEILVEAPSGATVTVRDKVSGATVATATSSGTPVKIASSTLTSRHPYTVTVVSGGASIGTWDVMPVPAADRASMNVSFDKNGRLLMQNKPRFGLGVYDSGLSYFTDPAQYESTIFAPGSKRQLGGINLNLYLNYHYGEASLQAMQALMTSLQNHGIMYLQTANCFAAGSYTRIPFAADQGSWATDFAKHPGAAGFYIMDECEQPLVPETKQHHGVLSGKAAGTMTFAATLAGPKVEHDVRLWAETQDMLGTDPYPLFGAEPTQGYSHFQVADYVAYTKSAVRDSRPIFSVLQFFKFTSDSRWPTAAEQRAHGIMSIVEGADGLFWWEIGQNGLQKDPTQFATQMAILKANVNELAALESVLVAPDAPTALTGNTTKYADAKAGRLAQLNLAKTNSWLYNAKLMYQREIDRINAGDLSHSPMLPGAADIRTKVKVVGGKGYVFAYNYTNKTLPVTFTWHTSPGSVTENTSGQSYAVAGSSWNDTLGAYDSRIYVIGNGGTPPGGGGDEPPPPATNPTVTFTNPASGATVSGTTTVTMAAAGGSGSGYSYKLAVDGANVYTGANGTFSWNTTTVANGTKNLTATVTDSNGKTGTASISVTVSNVAPSPTVTFTAPANGATVSGTTTVTMAASGGSGSGYTYKLAIDGAQVYSGTTPSYGWNTTTTANGTKTLTATVTDSNGKTGSASTSVTVSNTVTPPPASFTVSFTAPSADGKTVSNNLSIGLSTTAPWGQSKTWKISVGDKVLTTVTNTGTVLWYGLNTTTLANGLQTLKADVTYNGSTAAATRTINVSNGTVTPPPPSALTAAISSPAEGATVSGTQTVSMTSSGGASGSRTFKLEQVVGGTTTLLSTQTVTGTSASYGWNTTTVANGAASLKLTVTDSAGASTSVTRSVTVSNTVTPPPTASFTATVTSPAEGATIGRNVSIGTSTTAPWGKSKTFSVLVDGKVVGTKTTTGTVYWLGVTLTAGTHKITVKVTYNGQTATSAVRTITVR